MHKNNGGVTTESTVCVYVQVCLPVLLVVHCNDMFRCVFELLVVIDPVDFSGTGV